MRRYLTSEGYTVVTARDGAEGLKLARELLPLAITLDIMMPGMDGYQLASELQKSDEWQSIPIVLLTAEGTSPEQLERLNSGVRTVLTLGDSSREEMMQQVRELLKLPV